MVPVARIERSESRSPERTDSKLGEESAQLLEAVRRGEEGAWESLVTKYERMVLSVPMRLGLSTADCEDVVQATWLNLHESVQHIRRPGALVKWIITTTWRHARRVQERARPTAPVREEQFDEQAEDPVDLLAEIEERQIVQETIAELDEPCRALLGMLSAHRSYDEIHQELGIPMGSIGPSRRRCMLKMLALLERRGLH